MLTISSHLSVALVSFAAWAFAGCERFDHCPTQEELSPVLSELPDQLSSTGLYSELDAEHEVVTEGILEYQPAFELWSDGATKRRFLLLPEGGVIDVADPDDWQFPKGTKLWKEFTRDGRRVETRLLLKFGTGESDWAAAAYVWRTDGSDADLQPEGATNALDTEHDVPAANRCMGCHGGRRGRVLGFSAVQLANTEGPGAIAPSDLVNAGILSGEVPNAIVPGNATERAALGYLHANCGHCHNTSRPQSDGPRCYDPRKDIDMLLTVSRLGSVDETPTYETIVGSVVEPGDPEASKLIELVSQRSEGGMGRDQMPPLASERVDEDGLALLKEWVLGLR